MIINGEKLLLGRLASFAAKKALLGEQVNIVNCNKIVISGDKVKIFEDYRVKKARGNVFKGPFFPRVPERIVKRTIRGMLPYKREKGKLALKRVMCYNNVPEKFKKEKIEILNFASIDKLKSPKYVALTNISKFIGGK